MKTSSNNPISAWWREGGAIWDALAMVATALLTFIGHFLITPPHFSSIIAGLATFVVCIVIAAMFVLSISFRKKPYLKRWSVTLGILFVAALSLFGVYEWARSSWTCKYGNAEVVVGEKLTADAEAFVAREAHPLNCEELLLDYAGDSAAIWNTAELARRTFILLTLYVIALVLIAATIMTAVQVVRVSTL
jgi:hypothetical protein